MNTLAHFVIGPLTTAALGVLIVALVWTIVALVRARHGAVRSALLKSIPEAIGVMGIVAIVPFALVPNPGVETTVNLIPVAGLASNLFSSNWEIAIVNAVGNVGLFVPIGIALRWRFGLPARRAVVVGLALSIVVELVQLAINNGRSVDVDDVLLNVGGTLLGAAFGGRIAAAVERVTTDSQAVRSTLPH